MKNISKLYEELVTQLKTDHFHRATIVLTSKYSGLIFVLLFLVSVFVYIAFTITMGIPVGDSPIIGLFEEDTHLHEQSEALLQTLIVVNLTVWFLASVFSYFLARNTMRPIKVIHEQQKKFIADVAHEIRTPLSVIKSGGETMLRSDREVLEYKEYIGDSISEIDRLVTLSNDLLVLLKQDSAHVDSLELVDLSEILNLRIERIGTYADKSNIKIDRDIQAEVFVRGNSSELARVVDNLLKNAIDYNKKDGSINISLTRDADYVYLSAADTGIGIPKDDLDNVFNRFYKTDTSRVQKNNIGSGLGLSIVSEIISSHGGEIKVESELGKGSKFIVTIPSE